MPKKEEKPEANSSIFSRVSSLPFSLSTSLLLSLRKQVWFPDAIYPRLAFHQTLKHYIIATSSPQKLLIFTFFLLFCSCLNLDLAWLQKVVRNVRIGVRTLDKFILT